VNVSVVIEGRSEYVAKTLAGVPEFTVLGKMALCTNLGVIELYEIEPVTVGTTPPKVSFGLPLNGTRN
jgi:hypothetical protein